MGKKTKEFKLGQTVWCVRIFEYDIPHICSHCKKPHKVTKLVVQSGKVIEVHQYHFTTNYVVEFKAPKGHIGSLPPDDICQFTNDKVFVFRKGAEKELRERELEIKKRADDSVAWAKSKGLLL